MLWSLAKCPHWHSNSRGPLTWLQRLWVYCKVINCRVSDLAEVSLALPSLGTASRRKWCDPRVTRADSQSREPGRWDLYERPCWNVTPRNMNCDWTWCLPHKNVPWVLWHDTASHECRRVTISHSVLWDEAVLEKSKSAQWKITQEWICGLLLFYFRQSQGLLEEN